MDYWIEKVTDPITGVVIVESNLIDELNPAPQDAEIVDEKGLAKAESDAHAETEKLLDAQIAESDEPQKQDDDKSNEFAPKDLSEERITSLTKKFSTGELTKLLTKYEVEGRSKMKTEDEKVKGLLEHGVELELLVK